MRTRLLRPGYVVLHLLVAAAAVVCARFGIWQWGRGVDTGSIRNYSYGLEWWAFTVLIVAGWVKYCVDEVREAPAPAPAPAPVVAPPPVVAPVAVADEDDPELAAWNARFAELARRAADHS